MSVPLAADGSVASGLVAAESQPEPETLDNAERGVTVDARIPKLLLLGPALSGGGAERRFANIVCHIFDGHSDAAVLTIGNGADQTFIGKVIDLSWSNQLSYPRIIWQVRALICERRYEVVMAFGLFPNVIAIIANMLSGQKAKVIINEITRPKREAANSSYLRWLVHSGLRKWFYGRSALITANSSDGLREACELAGVPSKLGVKVTNVVDVEGLAKNAMAEADLSIGGRTYVICVGRLDFMKRIDVVVDAFAAIAGRSSECALVIVGDGEARPVLEAQVADLGLTDAVLFAGKLDNPFPLLKGASAFVLASEYEGFSNSALEAMFCDVPVITSLCSADAYEMCMEEAALGFPVGDKAELSRLLAAVLSDGALKQRLVSRAGVYRSRHELKPAIAQYEDVIRHVWKRSDANG